MTGVVERLLSAVEHGEPLNLAAVTDGQFGAVFDAVAAGPATVDLIVWLIEHPQPALAHPVALRLIRRAADPGVLAEFVAWLTRGRRTPAHLRRPLWEALIALVETRHAHYGVRSHALHGATFLAQDDRGLLRRLQATLLDLTPDDDGKFLRHAARITGAVLAHEPEDDVRALLGTLADVEDARDEAAMELGLDALRTGLDETTRDRALDAFRTASRWFAVAYAEGDERVDADLYRQSLDMLLAFQAGDVPGDVHDRVRDLRRSAFEYAAFLSTSDRDADTSSWLGSLVRERIHWSTLTLRLSSLDLSLRRPAWLRAAAVIEDELLCIYTASRSIFLRDASGGLEAVLQPRVTGALQRDRHYLDYLDQWIAENEGSDRLPDAEAMRKEVASARERSIQRLPPDAATAAPAVAAALEQGRVPPADRPNVVARIHASVLDRAVEAESPVVNEVVTRIVRDLALNPYFAEYSNVRQMMEAIVLHVTLFAAQRHNVSRSTLPVVAYLFDRSAVLPKEELLHRDLHTFLAASALAGWCQIEARDLGGGRADILFTASGTKIVAEVKRTAANLTQDGLVQAFGLQAVSYQTADVTLALLVVLDLFDRAGGQSHLTEQISVHRKTPEWGQTEYSVVVYRVQGRRRTPHDLNSRDV